MPPFMRFYSRNKKVKPKSKSKSKSISKSLSTATKNKIASFTRKRDTQRVFRIIINKQEANKCSMCLQTMSNPLKNGPVIKLKCGHKFHSDCLKTWLIRNNTCPLCREHVTTSERQSLGLEESPESSDSEESEEESDSQSYESLESRNISLRTSNMAGTQRNSPNSINIRLGELETQRIELEERLIPLRLRQTDLTNVLRLARNRENTDYNLFQDIAVRAYDRRALIDRNLRESNLGIAIREEEHKRRQHYDNGTMTSDAFRHATARLAKLNIRMNNRRRQALNALREEQERAESVYNASRDALALLYREARDLVSSIRQLETALSAVVDEEARLNSGRGKKRQRRATHKKGKKGILKN
jgi:hypothetical protein